MAAFDIGQDELQAALAALPEAQRDALQTAAERIRVFHERQKQELNGFTYTEPTARCWASASRRSTASASTSRAARRPIRRRC